MKWKRAAAVLLTGALLSSVAAGCGNSIDKTAVVATLDGKEITLGLANFMAQMSAVNYDAYLGSYYGNSMWDQDMMGDGSTMTQTVQDSTIDEIEEAYLLEANMASYDVEITQEDLDLISNTAEEFMNENSKDAINTMGATEEYVEEALRLYLIQLKMEDAIKAGADTEVSDDEAAQKTFSYYAISLPEEDSTETESVEEDSTEAEEESEEALKELAEEIAADAVDDFDGIADKYDQTMSTHSFGTQEDYFAEEVLKVADTLKEGEVSDLITTEDGAYYVIRLDSEFDEEATESRKSEIVTERQNDLYSDTVQGWKDAADWSVDEDLLSQITFGHGYTLITEESTETESAETESVQ